MAKSLSALQKKRRRPATRPQDPVIALRLAPDLVRRIDTWAKRQGAASRSDAIRDLLERSIVGSRPLRKRSKKAASKAREMAGEELNRLSDHSLPVEEQERRKRRLTKGPQEFRDLREDLPKPKR
jgi:hypothetical protein